MKNVPIKVKLLVAGLCVLLLCAGVYYQRHQKVAEMSRMGTILVGYGSVSANLEAIQRDPNDVGAHRGLADAYTGHAGPPDYPKAIKELQEVVRLDPSDRFNSYRLAHYLLKEGRKAEAVEVLKKLSEQGDAWGAKAKQALRKISEGAQVI